MGLTPPDVMKHELNQTMQGVLTWVSWGLVVVMLVLALRKLYKEGTPFYLFAILAAGLAAFAEPLYDVAFDLWFRDAVNGHPGGMWTHFTAFGVIQPNWTHSGYMILYANMALFFGYKIANGIWGRRELFALFALEIVASCTFEIIAINGHAYEYWGPHQFRLLHYPLVVPMLEATQICTFTVVGCLLWKRVRSWVPLLGLFLLFPVTFFGCNFGLGGPMIISLHLNDPASTPNIVRIGTLISMALTPLWIWGLSMFMPKEWHNRTTAAAAEEPVAASVS